MTYRGTVKAGVIVIEDAPAPADGTRVEVSVLPPDAPTWAEVFRDLIGTAPELPSDIAENHDHYLHGAPKGIDTQ